MKRLEWSTCGQCPFVQLFTGGKKLACGHGDVTWLKPYAEDRWVECDEISPLCPIPDAEAQMK